MAGELAWDYLIILQRVAIAFIVLDTFFTVCRFAARFMVKKAQWGWDDWLILPSWFFQMAICTCALLMCHYEGIGNPPAHAQIVLPSQLETQTEPAIKLIVTVSVCLLVAWTLPKLSLLCLYYRIFIKRPYRIATICIAVFLIATWFAYTCATLFSCRPIEYLWNRLLPDGYCPDENTYYRTWNGPQLLSDIAMLILPMPALWSLENVTGTKKLGLTLIFLTGSIGLITSCIKWYVFFHNNASGVAPYDTTQLISWTIIEPSTYHIAACLPPLRPLLSYLLPSWDYVTSRRTKRLSYTNRASAMLSPGISSPGFQTNRGSQGFARLDDEELLHGGTYSATAKSRAHSLGRDEDDDIADATAAAAAYPMAELKSGIAVTTDVSVTESNVHDKQ